MAPTYKCGGCDRERAAVRFSATTLRKYQESLLHAQRLKNQSLIKLPRCMDCTSGARHELKCAKCDVTKGLEGFSKAQRKNGGRAECIDCVTEREDREPNFDDEVEEQRIIEDIRTGTSSLSFAAAQRAMTNHSSPAWASGSSRTNTRISETDSEAGWGQPPIPIPEASPRAFHRTYSTNSNGTYSQDDNHSHISGKTGTGWDAFDSTTASQRNRVDSVGMASSSVVSRGTNPGFAKQGAVKENAHNKARRGLERNEQRDRQQQEQETRGEASASDNDDDDEDPY